MSNHDQPSERSNDVPEVDRDEGIGARAERAGVVDQQAVEKDQIEAADGEG